MAARLRVDVKFWILVADIVLLLVLLQTLPLDPPITKGLSILIFIAILWLTEALHITVTALLIPILATLLGVMPLKMALVNYASPIIFLFFGGFALATAMSKQGLDKIIANRIILIARGHFGLGVMLLFVAAAALSMWISNTATTAMFLPVALGLIPKEGDRKTGIFILLGLAYAASIGGMGTIVGTPPNAIAAAAVGLDFFHWMRFGLPVVIFLLPAMMFLLYVALRPKLSFKLSVKKEEFKWTYGRVATTVIFAIAATLWIFSHLISTLLGGMKGVDTLVSLLTLALITITKAAKWEEIHKLTNWGVLLLFGGGLVLGSVLKTTGTAVFLAKEFGHLLGGSPTFWIPLAVAFFVSLVTNVASNTASAALFVPVFALTAPALGMSPVLLAAVVGVSASSCFLLPIATGPNALIYAQGIVKQRDMLRAGSLISLAFLPIITIIAYLFF